MRGSVRVMLGLAVALAVPMASVVGQERRAHALGEFEFLPTSTGVLITAPHGTFDANTASLAVEAARRLGAGYVVARRFTVARTRINVNRPTEGAHLACAQELHTERAKEVYGLYAELVKTAASGRPLRQYVEIHGNTREQAARQIEVATTGVSVAEARSLKDEYAAMLARRREQVPDYPELALLIQPLDRVFFTASCAKTIGILATDLVPRAIHFELPRSGRAPEAIDATAALIADMVRGLSGER